MDDIIKEQIEEADIDYIIVTKSRKDILDDMKFESDEDRLFCDSIISNLEKYAADNIRAMNTVSIPYIGCLRINPVKRKFSNAKLHLSTIRKNMTKEEYKEYVKDIVHEFAQEEDKKEFEKLILTKIRRNNKNKYELLYKTFGKNHAELFIKSIRWLVDIPYDEEFDNYYSQLKD